MSASNEDFERACKLFNEISADQKDTIRMLREALKAIVDTGCMGMKPVHRRAVEIASMALAGTWPKKRRCAP